MLVLAMALAAASCATTSAGEIVDAVQVGDVAKVKQLLAAKPELVNERGGSLETTPLHRAAVLGNKEIAAMLLALKADVNALDRCHLTPLHKAAYAGKKEIAELLLANGADVDGLWGRDGSRVSSTPLLYAVDSDDVEMVELLLAHKATVNAPSRSFKKGWTPLDFAEHRSSKHAAEIAAVLRTHGGKSRKE